MGDLAIKGHQLHHGDCLSVMPDLARDSVDLVFCDPPYGGTRNKWDSVIPVEPMWRNLSRIVKPGGAILFTACQPFASKLMFDAPVPFRHEWIWHKNRATGHLNAARAPLRAHENILVFAGSQPHYSPQKTTGHRPVNTFYTRRSGGNYGDAQDASGGGATDRFPRSVQVFPVVSNSTGEKLHPTQKPVALVEYFIRTYSQPGAVVLDFAMGSGTTGVACVRSGRRFIGIELDRSSFDIALTRIEQAVSAEANKGSAA